MLAFALFSAALVAGVIYSLHDLYSNWRFTADNPLKCKMLDGKPVRFHQYAYYYVTLHIDYTVIACCRVVTHTIKRLLWRFGLRKERTSHASQLGEFFLDSTCMLYFKPESFDHERKEAIFYIDDFNVPNIYAAKGYIIVKDFQVKVDLVNRKAIECKLGGKDLDMHSALRLAGWLFAVNCHVVIHNFATKACEVDHKLPEIRLASTYSLAINSASLGATPWMHTRNYENQTHLLNRSITNSFPKHTASDLDLLAPYSQTISFLIQARQVVFSIIGKYQIDIDPEAFFLETVVHSIDHQIAGEIIDPLSMIGTKPEDQKLCGDVNWIFALFVAEIDPFISNSKLHSSKVDWHKDMYARLAKINTRLANMVDWCIAT